MKVSDLTQGRTSAVPRVAQDGQGRERERLIVPIPDTAFALSDSDSDRALSHCVRPF